MKDWAGIFKNITMLTQFGLSFITPLLLCLALCWWLTSRFGLGGWIYIPGFFLGLGGSGMVAYKLYVSVTHRQKSKRKNQKYPLTDIYKKGKEERNCNERFFE